MIQIYVTEKPKRPTDCPFHRNAECICSVTESICCLLNGETVCKHLIDLSFAFAVEESNEAEETDN